MVRSLKENWLFWYFLIIIIAIFVRLIPALTHMIWGCDFGIYYGLTKTFVETGNFFNPYYGWGGSYHQFPVLYAISGGLHFLTGLPIADVMMKAVPIFGGLSVAVFFFLANEILENKKYSLIATAFLAVMPIHVYQTAHTAPLTLGHFFLILSILFFLKGRKNNIYYIPLMISSALLLMTHHLSTYMFLISIMFISFYDNWSYKKWKPYFKYELLFIVVFSAAMFLYWNFIATDVGKHFFQSLFYRQKNIYTTGMLIAVFYGIIAFGIGMIWLRRKFNLYKKHRHPNINFMNVLFVISIIGSLIILIIYSFREVPWISYRLNVMFILLFFPTVLMLGFGVVGFFLHRTITKGDVVRGWLIALSSSFILSLFLGSAMKYNRHIEYFMVPMAIVAVVGIMYFIKERTSKREFWYVFVISILVISNAVAIVPVYNTFEISTPEIISPSDLDVIAWMDRNISKNATVVCSDHRIERFLEAFNFTTTKDKAFNFWNNSDLNDLKKFSVTYVFIDNFMVQNGVLLNDTVGIIKVKNETFQKFYKPPFYSLYRNESEDSWAEVFEVRYE